MRSKTSSECLTNSDCQQLSTCSVTSSIDFVRDASTTMPCSGCGWLGSESACVMDRAGSTGVCACVSVSQSNSLHACSQSILAQRVPLLDATGQCLVTNDPNIPQIITPSLVLEFATLAIAPCALGISNSVCLAVKLPLSSGGQYSRYFAVLLGLSSGGGITGRRRLLQLQQPHATEDPANWNWTNSLICNKTFSSGAQDANSRTTGKWCIHWMIVSNMAQDNFNLTLMKDQDLLLSTPLDMLALIFSNQDMAFQLLTNPSALRFIIKQHSGLFPAILETFLGITLDAFFAAKQNNNGSAVHVNQTNEIKRGRKILQTTTTTKISPKSAARLPIQQCAALEVPVKQISAAFWDTVGYYDHNINGVKTPNITIPTGHANNTNSSANETADNNQTTWWYLLPPKKEQSQSKNSDGWLVDLTNSIVKASFGGTTDGTQILDAVLSDIPYNETVSKNYFTGRRVLTELSTCNYTALTFGSHGHSRALLPWLIFLTGFFLVLTSLCSPSLMITWFAWIILFPMVLFWAVYNISPLCWPMIPPKFPHDLASEFTSLVPTSIEIPTFLVDKNCSVRGILSDGTYDQQCFKQCGQDPFLMLSWQDPAAWWLCDIISTDLCLSAGRSASTWGVLQDFVSSTVYYSDVISFGSTDSDFVGAHRLCAFFMSYELVFAFMALVMVIFILPSVLQAIIEIFSGALILLIYASSVEATDDH